MISETSLPIIFFDRHDNLFCLKYGNCKESTTPRLDDKLYGKVVAKFMEAWCTEKVLQKYLNCRDKILKKVAT